MTSTEQAQIEASDAPRIILESDDAPELWQYLHKLGGDDLIVELLVNDLDAGATRTEIRFETERLVCSGNGRQVDVDGWKRLRLMRGAGRKAPAKRGLFGIKNHGLKACFTIGNDILVRSAGKQILQTLFGEGPDAPAYPGVRRPEIDDPEAPSEGARIEVPYRRRSFVAPDGEPFEFAAATDARLEVMFREAVRDLPQRLLGILRPTILENYELALQHHRLGEATLRFKCGRWRLSKGFLRFRRSCEVTASDGLETASTREQAALSPFLTDKASDHADFFAVDGYRDKTGRRLLGKSGVAIEVAWKLDASDRLSATPGKLRYPISYYGDGPGAASGFAFEYAAPFRSDAERHELGAQSHDWNGLLTQACDALAAKILTEELLPAQGPSALKLIADGADEDRLKTMIVALLAARAFPAVNADGKSTPIRKGQRLLIPAYQGEPGIWSRRLARVAPPSIPILDSRTPARIVALLGSAAIDGWKQTYLRFDEGDVMDRLRGPEAEWFPWDGESQWRRRLGDPEIAEAHLDALQPHLAALPPGERPLPEGVHLPDTTGALRPLDELHSGVSLPQDLLDMALPPVVHPVLKDHPVLRLRDWSLKRFRFADLLATGQIGSLSLAARRRFLAWLANNLNAPGRDDWPALKALPIWSSTRGDAVPIEALCKPKSTRLAEVMSDTLLRPSRDVQRICQGVDQKRASLRIRDMPTPEEISAFYRDGVSGFPTDAPLTPEARHRFHAFESGLLAFGSEGRLAAGLRRLQEEAVALDRNGQLRPVGTLLRGSSEIDRLALPPEILLDRPAEALDRLLPPLARPSWTMVADALRANPDDSASLLPRFRALRQADASAEAGASLDDLVCLPFEGRLYAPRDLAFKGNSGDYWGRWKTVISAKGLPDDAQDLYRYVGVVRSLPEARTARAFFAWLSSQSQPTIAEHTPQVIRHISHAKSLATWSLTPPETPCVPVESVSGAELLLLSQATRRVVINDFAALAEEIRGGGATAPVRLAIDTVATSAAPIADELRAAGLPSLRATAKGPLAVQAGRETEAPKQLGAMLAALRSESVAKRLKKQLKEYDVRAETLEPRWQHKLAAIKKVRVGQGLRAEYKVRNRRYWPVVSGAVLEQPGELWLEDGPGLEEAFFAAIAALIFVDSLRYLPLVLKAALDVRVNEFQRPGGLRRVDTDAEDVDPDLTDDSPDDDPAESLQGHPGAEPDLTKNKPKPAPLWSGETGRKRSTARPASTRPQVVDEDVQRRQLKEDHYAWHCQISLAVAGPAALAAAGSYAEFQENRQRMVEAHHPDKVAAGGARNAGNLLILSRVNHERFGRAISREQVTDALAKDCAPRQILDADGVVWVTGVVAEVLIPATGEIVSIFFTHAHRDYWLRMAVG